MKLKKIKPLFTTVITTANVNGEDYKQGGVIIKGKDELRDYQEVIAVGDTVRNVKVGDLVHINFINYGIVKQRKGSIVNDMEEYHNEIKFDIPTITLNDKPHLFLQERDIDYIIEDYEE